VPPGRLTVSVRLPTPLSPSRTTAPGAAPGTGLALVVFDLAGTTVRDGGQVAAALTAALAGEGVTARPADLARSRGTSKRLAILEWLPPGPDLAQRAERTYARFRGLLLDRFRSDGVAAVEGAEEVFGWLRGRRVRVALTTGFDREVTDTLLALLGWHGGLVDTVVSDDEVLAGRPAPALIQEAMRRCAVSASARVAAVGDTVRDLLAGHRAGVGWNVGVLSGAHTLARAVPHRVQNEALSPDQGVTRGAPPPDRDQGSPGTRGPHRASPCSLQSVADAPHEAKELEDA
jgi:phosphoglycolate phosphatase